MEKVWNSWEFWVGECSQAKHIRIYRWHWGSTWVWRLQICGNTHVHNNLILSMSSSQGTGIGMKITWIHLRLEVLAEQVAQKDNAMSIWGYLLEYSCSDEQWHISWIGKEMRTERRQTDWSIMHTDHLSVKDFFASVVWNAFTSCLQTVLPGYSASSQLQKASFLT